MKFDQLIEYNMGNIFVELSYTICGGESNPKPLLQKIKIEHISGLMVQSLYSFFYCMPSWGLSKNIEANPQTSCFYLI